MFTNVCFKQDFLHSTELGTTVQVVQIHVVASAEVKIHTSGNMKLYT